MLYPLSYRGQISTDGWIRTTNPWCLRPVRLPIAPRRREREWLDSNPHPLNQQCVNLPFGHLALKKASLTAARLALTNVGRSAFRMKPLLSVTRAFLQIVLLEIECRFPAWQRERPWPCQAEVGNWRVNVLCQKRAARHVQSLRNEKALRRWQGFLNTRLILY